MQTNGNRVDV